MSQTVATEITRSKQDELVRNAKKNKEEVGIFELLDTQPSGFIKEGTEKLPEPVELAHPAYRKILTNSAYYDGKGVRQVIRHVANAKSILVSEQNKEGVAPNPKLDQIIFKNGRLIVSSVGKTGVLLKYLRASSMNIGAEGRIEDATPVYKEIFPEKETEGFNVKEFDIAKAVGIVQQLVTVGKDGYEYDEVRLNAYAKLFNVIASSPSSQIASLIATAKAFPVEFVQKIQHFEGNMMIDLAHAETLGLISFGDTQVTYVGENKVLTSYSNKLDKEQKVRTLATLFQSPEGAEELRIFQTKLAVLKENKI